jgi:WavE lipopolysaccharide synthesis
LSSIKAIEKVTPKDISFVIQGPVFAGTENGTENLIDSIRSNFLGSEIILSTWSNQASNCDFLIDVLVESTDPGSFITYPTLNVMNNVNRQIVSTVAGLKHVNTKYCVKIRSDLMILNDNILRLLNSELMNCYSDSDHRLFSQRVIFSNEFFINPKGALKVAHHPCDWIQIGCTQDLIEIWDIPLAFEDDLLFWNSHEKPIDFPFVYSQSRYSAEEWIWVNFLKKKMDLTYPYSGANLSENIAIQEHIIRDNLIIANRKILGFASIKYKPNRRMLYVVYSFFDWVKLSGNLSRFDALKLLSTLDFRVMFWRFAYPSLIVLGHFLRLIKNYVVRKGLSAKSYLK